MVNTVKKSINTSKAVLTFEVKSKLDMSIFGFRYVYFLGN